MDVLAEALWPGGPPPTAGTALHVHISGLRKRLGAQRIRTMARGYRLALVGGDEVDSTVFASALAAARQAQIQGRAGTAHRLAGAALQLWRGRPCPELDDWALAAPELAALVELQLDGTELRAEALLADGQAELVVEELTPHVRSHPHRERLRHSLALALYRCGRQIDALDELRTLRTLLSEEFGLDPSLRVRKLERDMLRQDPGLLLEPGRRRTLAAMPGTAMYGREHDIASVLRLLRSGKSLVTLTGPGGVGKTRLALAVAARFAEADAAAVRFVDLTALSAPDLLLARVADELEPDRSPGGDPVSAVERHFGRCSGGPHLLVLDNLEQVWRGGVELARLTQQCADLQVLATSRHTFQVRVETVYQVPPLIATPRDGSDPSPAAMMFCERADAAQGTRVWTTETLRAVDQIVALVDGLPLAIELAAARCRLLGPHELAGRLRHSVGVLAHGPSDLPLRHQSMAAAVQCSIDLLNDAERALLRQLVGVAASFDLDAVRQLADVHDELVVLSRLESLVVASLVRPRPDVDDGTGQPRFSILRVIAQQVVEGMSTIERAMVEERQLSWVRALVSQARPHLRSEHRTVWLNRLDLQLDDIRAAIEHLIRAGRVDEASSVMADLRHYWTARARSREGLAIGERLAELDGLTEPARGRMLRLCALMHERCADYETSYACASLAIDVSHACGDLDNEAAAYACVASTCVFTGRHEEAERAWQRALELGRQVGDDEFVVLTLGNIGLAALLRDDFGRAMEVYTVALVELRARRLLDAVADTLLNLAWAELGLGNVQPAAQNLRESLELAVADASAEDIAYHCLGVARLATELGCHADALRLATAAEGMLETIGEPFEPFEQRMLELVTTTARRHVTTARDSLGTADTAGAAGAMPAEQTVAQARAVLASCAYSHSQMDPEPPTTLFAEQ